MSAPFVDRIEGEVAVLIVDGRERKVPLAQLPKGVREGACLTADLKALDEQAGEALKTEIAERRKRLQKGDKGGDFSL